MEFSEHQRLFLAAVCKHFHETGTWPTYGMIDRQLRSHKDLDVEEVGRELDTFMHDSIHAPLSGWDPKQAIVMNVSAFYRCQKEGIYSELSIDLDAFMAVMHRCIARYETDTEDVPITSAEVRHDYPFEPFGEARVNVLQLVMVEGQYGSASYDSNSPQDWSFTVSDSIRKYRDVETIEDYLAVRKKIIDKFLEGLKAVRFQSGSPINSLATEEELYLLSQGAPDLPTEMQTTSQQGVSATSKERSDSKPKVFVSHKSEDLPIALKVVEHLNLAGAEAWIDANDLGAGSFQQQIDDALGECEWFILVLTRNALDSAWVKQEVELANMLKNEGKIRDLIFIKTDSVKYNDLPTFWRNYQIFDASSEYTSVIIRTLKAIGLLSAM